MTSVTKSRFTTHAPEIIREVERTGKAIVITERGMPVFRLSPLGKPPRQSLRSLRKSVVKFDAPVRPVGVDDWETSR